jgi:branched-chain amino acid transport system permease protein
VVLRPRVWWGLLATLAALLATAPSLLNGTGLLQSFGVAGVFFIAVLGLDLLMGFTGQVSLGNAGFMAIGGYTAAILTTHYQVPALAATAGGLALSLLTALMLALATSRLRGLYMALATLAFGLLVDSIVVGLTDVTGGPSGLVGVPSFSIGPLEFADDTANFYLVWGVGLALLVLSWNLARSNFGRALQAIRADQTAARALGIRVSRHKTLAFMLSAGYASLAGSLYAFDFHFLSPEMVSTARSLEMVTMLVVGGQSTLVGPLFGATLITTLPTLVQPLAAVKTLAEGALLVLILLYAPGGIFGLLAQGAGRLSSRVRGRSVREPAT